MSGWHEVELVGGLCDGKRLQVRGFRDELLIPPPQLVNLEDYSSSKTLYPPANLVYKHAGIRDDGTDWYKFKGER